MDQASELFSRLWASPYTRTTAYIAVGALSFIATPGVLGRVFEVDPYFRVHPVRCALEITGCIAGFGGLAFQFFGIRYPRALVNALETHIPEVVSRWRKIPSWARLALRLAATCAIYRSFNRGSNPLPRKDAKSLVGKTVLVTGATNGLGLYCAKKFAALGAKVVFIARDKVKSEETVKQIRAETKNENVEYLLADMCDLKAVAALGPDLDKAAPNGYDILLLNAGYPPSQRSQVRGPSGLEASITAMHLAHFLLSKMLWKKLNAEARIVITASVGGSACNSVEKIFLGIEDTDEEAEKNKPYEKVNYYARSKLANLMLGRLLGRLADSDKRRIRVSAHHPGTVASNIWENIDSPILRLLLSKITFFQMRNLEEGSATLLDAAVSETPLIGEESAPNGSYYVNSTLVNSGPFYQSLADDKNAAEYVWNESEKYIAPFLPSGSTWEL